MSTPRSARTPGGATPRASTLVASAPSSGGDQLSLRSRSSAATHSLDNQVILEEDEYTSALSDIIARDFFPSLERAKATNEYLEALESMDEVLLERSVRRLIDADQGRTPLTTRRGELVETPRFDERFDTPLRTPRTPAGGSSSSSSAIPTGSFSLDSFQQTFTSQDNASFTTILTSENKTRKDRHAWAYAAEKRAKAIKAADVEGTRRLIADSLYGTEMEDRLTEDEREERRRRDQSRQVRRLENGRATGLDEVAALEKGKGRELFIEESADPLRIASRPEQDPAEAEVEALLAECSAEPSSSTLVLVAPTSSPPSASALTIVSSSEPLSTSTDVPLPADSHLARALVAAGLPPTAMVAVSAEQPADRFDYPSTAAPERGVVVPAWDFKTRNSLMFAPDADVSPFLPVPTLSSSSELLPPKKINHGNTRLPEQQESNGGADEPPSPSHSRIAAAINGTPYRPEASSSMPSVEGYPLVAHLPSPTPSSLGPARLKELLTWGTLLSTPRALGTADDPSGGGGATPFRIHDPSPRDDLARRLAQTAGKGFSDRARGMHPSSSTLAASLGVGGLEKKRKGEMLPPTWTPRRRPGATVDLSPAAQGLLQRTRGTASASSTPRSVGGSSSSSSSSTAAAGLVRSAAARRGEAMERGWGLGGSGSGGAKFERRDLGKTRWSASPSPRRKPEDDE